MSGKWTKIKDVRSATDGYFFSTGIYPRLELVETTEFKTRKGDDCFKLEARVLEEPIYSDQDRAFHDKLSASNDANDRKSGHRFSPGEIVVWMANVTQHGDTALANVKALAEALLPGHEIGEAEILDLVERNAAQGYQFRAEAIAIVTRDKKRDFTKVVFRPLAESAAPPASTPADEPPAAQADPARRKWGN